MRLKGFENPALNLGSINVQLATCNQLYLVTCDTCDFTANQMFYGACNHTFCADCLLLLDHAPGNQDVLETHCVLCERDVSVMKLRIYESFIGDLQCHCPRCDINVLLGELKGHLKSCYVGPLSLSQHRNPTHPSDGSEIVHANGKGSYTSTVMSVTQASDEMLDPNDVCGENVSNDKIDTASFANMVASTRRELVAMVSTTKDDLRNELTHKMGDLEERLINQVAVAAARPPATVFHLTFILMSHLVKCETYCTFNGMTLRFQCAKNRTNNFVYPNSGYSTPNEYIYDLLMTVLTVGHQQEIYIDSVSVTDITGNGVEKRINLTAADLRIGNTTVLNAVLKTEPKSGNIFKVAFGIRNTEQTETCPTIRD